MSVLAVHSGLCSILLRKDLLFEQFYKSGNAIIWSAYLTLFTIKSSGLP